MKTWTIRCGNNCETRNSSENIQDRGKQDKQEKHEMLGRISNKQEFLFEQEKLHP